MGSCISYPEIEVLYQSDKSFLLGDSNGYGKTFDTPPPFYIKIHTKFNKKDRYYKYVYDLLYHHEV